MMNNAKTFSVILTTLIVILLQSYTAYADNLSKEDICKAITEEQIISILYKDDDASQCSGRLIEPYLVAEGNNGKFYLRGFQISGCAKSNLKPSVRTYRIDRITRSSITSDQFSQEAEARKAEGWDGCLGSNCYISHFICE